MKFQIIAGPCAIESQEICDRVADRLSSIQKKIPSIQFVFKSSFDKANRTSYGSSRGKGLDDGLKILSKIKTKFELPITTDVHECCQVNAVADVVDILQVPAFLCRQTDLLKKCSESGIPVNVKKGQFLSPWAAKNIVDKLVAFGAKKFYITERGFSFGYGGLVVDPKSFMVIRKFAPVIFDATHSVQEVNSGDQTGGNREFVEGLCRAAIATGVDGLFFETHPSPNEAWSDKDTQIPLMDFTEMIERLVDLYWYCADRDMGEEYAV